MANLEVPKEQRWPHVIQSPISINGTVITVPDTYNLRAKQRIQLEQTGLSAYPAEIVTVFNNTTISVKPYQLADQKRPITIEKFILQIAPYSGGTLTAREQKRNSISGDVTRRATYAEEPTMAWRSHLVDYWGSPWTVDNPFPVQLSDGDINIGTVNGELEVQLTHLDNSPDTGDVHDSVRIGGGTFEAAVDSDNNLHVEVHGNDFNGLDRILKTSRRGEVVSKDHKAQDTIEERNFGVSTLINSIAGTLEVPYMLVRNPVGSGKTLRIFRSRTGVNSKSSASVFKTYIAPTITDLGTPLTIRNLYIKSSATASLMEAYRFPTVSSNGILVFNTVVPSSFRTVSEEFAHYVMLDPGFDALITIQNDQNNTPVHIDLFWTEVDV